MAHYRKIEVNGNTYEYAVGTQATFIKGIGSFSHRQIGFCVDVSMDKYRVTPGMVRGAIEKFLAEKNEAK